MKPQRQGQAEAQPQNAAQDPNSLGQALILTHAVLLQHPPVNCDGPFKGGTYSRDLDSTPPLKCLIPFSIAFLGYHRTPSLTN